MTNPLHLAAGFLLGLILYRIFNYGFGFKRDATDGTKKRPGLIILTDHGTGVQYVMNSLGGMTVRVDVSGKPMTGGRNG